MNAELLRRVVLPAWQYVKGQDALQLLRLLERTQWLSRDELEALQWQRIGALLDHAALHVPYYAEVMQQRGVHPQALVRERSLGSLPLLDKSTIGAHRDVLRAGNFPADRFVANGTGGSTGEPLRFFDDRAELGWSTATVWRAHRWLDVDIAEPAAYLWGADFDLTSYRGYRGRLRSYALNMLMLPAWRLSRTTVNDFWAKLVAFKPRLLVAYAGALSEMATLLGPDRDPLPGLKAIVVSAELLSAEARANIERSFKVPVHNRYGGRDLKFVAQECPTRQGLHVNAESVLVEIVKDGKPAPPGVTGEVVITRLDNFAMPFVRYRTGDLAAMADGPCRCGRSLPLLQKLEGRVQDAIVTGDGRVISGPFFAHMFKDCLEIKAFQIHQLAVDRIQILVVLTGGAAFTSRARVDRLVQEFVGASMRIEYEVRDEIPLTRSGKRRVVVSHLDANGPRISSASSDQG
jgi:phenylacetate-CoA ligase